jgi:hypothetical protein
MNDTRSNASQASLVSQLWALAPGMSRAASARSVFWGHAARAHVDAAGQSRCGEILIVRGKKFQRGATTKLAQHRALHLARVVLRAISPPT